MTLGEIALACFLGGLFVLIAVRQVSSQQYHRLTGWDIAGLLPVWRFFAPEPGRFDYHLLYRDKLRNELITPWREIQTTTSCGSLRAIWNPSKRSNKALVDIVSDLAREWNEVDDGRIMYSVPYIALLNRVSNLPRLQDADGTQFAVFVSPGLTGQSAELLFASNFHSIS
jgi:hypothetical protein